MACYNIMAVLMNHRTKKAMEMQQVLTKHGCLIKMRLGLHEAGDVCSEEGLILLQLCGEAEEIKKLETDLNALEGIKAQVMQICSE